MWQSSDWLPTLFTPEGRRGEKKKHTYYDLLRKRSRPPALSRAAERDI